VKYTGAEINACCGTRSLVKKTFSLRGLIFTALTDYIRANIF